MNKKIKFVLDEFVYGGHLLSLGASGIVYLIIFILGQEVHASLLVVAYLIMQIIYLHDHVQGAAGDQLTNPERAQHILKRKKKTLIMLYSYFLFFLAFLYYINNVKFFALSLLMVLSGVAYTFFLKNLTKKIFIFKNLVVAFVWAFFVVLIAVYYEINSNFTIYLLFLFIFSRWLLNTMFFDIKDIESDKIEKIKTLPVVVGKSNAIRYLHLINLFSFLPLIIGVVLGEFPVLMLWFLIFYLYGWYYLNISKKDNANIRFISYVFVDAEYVLWAIMIGFIKIF